MFLQAVATYFDTLYQTSLEMDERIPAPMYTTHRRMWKMMRRLADLERRDRDEDAEEFIELNREISQLARYFPLCIDEFGTVSEEAMMNTWWDVIVPRKEEGRYPTVLGLAKGIALPQYVQQHFDIHPAFWATVDL
jgi:hypothetical protein